MRVEGKATTADGMRVIRRLCRHWGHKFETRVGDDHGIIQLRETRVELRAVDGGVDVVLENPEGDVMQRTMEVVAEHMQRMAGGEAALQVEWMQEGAAGTAAG